MHRTAIALACAIAGATPAVAQTTITQQASRSDDFVSAAGIVLQPATYGSNEPVIWSQIRPMYRASGFRFARVSPSVEDVPAQRRERDLANAGFKFDWLTQNHSIDADGNHISPTIQQNVAAIEAVGVGYAASIEGLNEPDTPYSWQGVDWPTITVAWQNELRAYLAANDPALSWLPLLLPAVTTSVAANCLAGQVPANNSLPYGNGADCTTSIVPYGTTRNFHRYLDGDREPETIGYGTDGYGSLTNSFSSSAANGFSEPGTATTVSSSGFPAQVTEGGYSNYSGDIPASTIATYLPRYLMENFSGFNSYTGADSPTGSAAPTPVTRTYLYDFYDQCADATNPQCNYGLVYNISSTNTVNNRLTWKPQGIALRNLLALMSDTGGTTFTPGSLTFTYSGDPAGSLRIFVFQRQDGSYILALWQDLPLWMASGTNYYGCTAIQGCGNPPYGASTTIAAESISISGLPGSLSASQVVTPRNSGIFPGGTSLVGGALASPVRVKGDIVLIRLS